MTDTTTRLSLPLIAEAQAQKHVTHNEGLLMLDALVQAAVKDRDLTTPPATPAEGEAWIVAAGATDAWSGQDNAIAVWQNGAWRFFAPAPGWRVWIEDEGLLAVWDGSAWIRASGGVASLNPADGGMVGINTTADATNRLAVKSDAVLFSHDDVSGSGSGDVRLTVNKATAGNTASLMFQDGFSGRAELGLTGDDDFRIKVSPDGATWHEALAVDRNDGSVTVRAISGDGSGLTNVDAERLGGDPASAYAKLSGAVFTGGVTAAGFTGDGGGLTNVNAAYLGGKSPSAYALLSGADFTGAVSAASFSGDGSGLTNVDAAKLGGRPASDYALASDVPAATRLNPADGGMVGINTTADATNRLAVKSDAVLFSHDDVSGSGSGDVRLAVNKATAGNTASLMFQDGFSGRAELGLTGDDDFRIKVSADGGSWHESIVVDRDSGWVRFPSGGVRELLRSDRYFFVNPAAGDDLNDGLSAATALKTVEEAIRRCYQIDTNGYSVYILLADGTYPRITINRQLVGGGVLTIRGNGTSPDRVVFASSGWHNIGLDNGAQVSIENVKLENTGSGSLLYAQGQSLLKFFNVEFGSCNRDHIEVTENSIVRPWVSYTISGGARSHIHAKSGTLVNYININVTITNTPDFAVAFVWFRQSSVYADWNVTWNGGATGRRYIADTNAVIDATNAAPDFFPGDEPGLEKNGGYYG